MPDTPPKRDTSPYSAALKEQCKWDVEYTTATVAVARDGAVLYLFEPCQYATGGLIIAPDGRVKRIPGEEGEVRSVLLEVVKHIDLVESFCGARGGCAVVEQVESPSICINGGEVCATVLGGKVHVYTKIAYLGTAPNISLDGAPCREDVAEAVKELVNNASGFREEGEPVEVRLLRLGKLARPKIVEVYDF